jgi:hypothetical protein
MRSLLADLADLVLPGACAGCGTPRVPLRYGVCADCVAVLEALEPAVAGPSPRPAGLPPCTAVGPYAGVLREVLLAYKERGRYRLGAPLGALLAGAVTSAVDGVRVPLICVPVPSTARAVRERHGDHLGRLAAHAVRRLRGAGWDAAVARPLRALPRPDSASGTRDAGGSVAACGGGGGAGGPAGRHRHDGRDPRRGGPATDRIRDPGEFRGGPRCDATPLSDHRQYRPQCVLWC